MVYCRLRFNGELTTEYRVGLYVDAEVWSQKANLLQRGDPQTQLIESQLIQIQSQHEYILRSLQLIGDRRITATIIQQRWQQENVPQKAKKDLTKPDPQATLLATYRAYLTHLDTRPPEDRKAEKPDAVIEWRGFIYQLF